MTEHKEMIKDIEFMVDDFECRESNEKHSGDCTNDCHTCQKCLWQMYICFL